jgi:chemotaxis protein CheD
MNVSSAVSSVPAPSVDPCERPHVFLHPGQLFAAALPTAVTTIVGSCVSVCLWDRRLRVGGINHFLLPQAPPCAQVLARPYVYADLAIAGLIENLLGLGSQPRHLEAKVFGGAHLLGSPAGDGPGSRNVRAALDRLKAASIPVVAQDLSGPRGRKIHYNTQSNEVLVRLL